MLTIRVLPAFFAISTVVATINASAQDNEIAAEVNGTHILSTDIDAKLGNNLSKLQQQIFDLRQKQLDTMIDQKLLEQESAKRGITISTLVEAEIMSHVSPATTDDAEKFFKENSSKLKGDFKSLEEQIKNYLTAQRTQNRQREYLSSLRAAAKVEVYLARPPVFRATVATGGAPSRGNAHAPVTIVEFSDFHCPYCRRVQPVLDELRARYGDKVRLVYRDFPLDNLHAQARAAAEASHCAIEQGKFWEFHDQVFNHDPDSSQPALDRFAKDAGMDVASFHSCLDSGKYKTSVAASTEEGTRLGISGTPTFFINGRFLQGAQPVEAFAKVIDEELAVAAAAKTKSSPQLP